MMDEQIEKTQIVRKRKPIRWAKFKTNLPLHLMMLPAVIISIVFCYVPMYGIVIAFQKFIPAKGLFGACSEFNPAVRLSPVAWLSSPKF